MNYGNRRSWSRHPRLSDDFTSFIDFITDRGYAVCESLVGVHGDPYSVPVDYQRLHAEWLKHRGHAAPYDPGFGDSRVCRCGHTYYRHFDTYEDMFPVGCKYCDCHEFVPERSKTCEDCEDSRTRQYAQQADDRPVDYST